MSLKPRSRAACVLSVVERGWRGARQCSIALAGQGVPVTHLIKGWVPKPVRAIIRPVPGVRLVIVPRLGFWPTLWSLVAGATLTRRLGWIIVDHERTLGVVSPWCRLFGIRPLLIRDTIESYDLWQGEARVPVQALLDRPQRCAA